MDCRTLPCSLDFVSGGGFTLSSEQKAALQTSMVTLAKDYKFKRVLFWGKLLGVRADYYIAQGVTEDEMRDKTTLYSFNCMDWYLLPVPTEEMIAKVSAASSGHFTGDPSHIYEPAERNLQEEGEEITEEKRLAATVFTIDEEASVVPRGAFIKSIHGTVQINRCFEGLSLSEAGRLKNYLHFTESKNLEKKSILEMAELDPSIDFLDPLSEDVPKGSWSLQFERGDAVCVIRSLVWLGLTFYHVPLTSQHGYVYVGNGLKNLYLPFML
ncbi:radial spoke head protein 9 homolog [Denticeps clupeoides]|uniref:Radial spoke head protein 9 homolog n=1 Tax=Denticeps clupeoides TaxID=299321 RepID=A0AAY4BKS2_9TELE|nr:radial spoke head protein 9 homolog [Denticeps clupeoides]